MMVRSDWFLALGALVGIGIATAGVVQAPSSAIADDAVATVNGAPIRRADYETALAAVAADGRRSTSDPTLRQHVLERLIDEELLVQAAIELGLAQRDRRVRADLSSATLSFIKDAPLPEPTETDLKDLFEASPGYFGGDSRVEIEERFFALRAAGDDAAALARARAARAQWQRGEAPSADPPPLGLPSGLVPVTKLEQYLGPTAARAIAILPVGVVSEPVRSGDGYRLVRVIAKRDGDAPRFEAVRGLVRSEWRRRQTEAELRRFLSDRRTRAKVAVAQELGS